MRFLFFMVEVMAILESIPIDFPPTFDNIPEVLPPSNPIVYWTFNELNGTQIRDDSGKENHASFDDNLTKNPNLFDYSEPGKDGTALRFDGNQTIVLRNDSVIMISGGHSVFVLDENK